MAKRAKGVKGFTVTSSKEGKTGKPRGRRPAVEANDAPEPRGGTFIAIKRSEFDRLHNRCKAAERALADERGSLGGLISDAAENNHLHAKAYGMFKKLDKMEPVKRSEQMFHFRLYCSWGGWDELYLFSDRLPETSKELAEAFDKAQEPAAEPSLPGISGQALDDHLTRVENGGGASDPADSRPF